MTNFRLANKHTGVAIQINSQGFVYDYQEPSIIAFGDEVLLVKQSGDVSAISAVDVEKQSGIFWQPYNNIPMPNPYYSFQYYEAVQSGSFLTFDSISGSNDFSKRPPAPWN